MIPARHARLVLVTPDGIPVGALPAIPVATPWWQEAEPVVRAVRDRYGLEVTILRLLETERDGPHGGLVTYLAETTAPVRAEPWAGMLDDHPLRQTYARPGGPSADLAWARSVLDARGMRSTGSPVQVRSWNLSSLWRLPVEGQTAWLKVVPPFFAHEGTVLELLAGGPVPSLLGHDGARILMAEVPGEDLYDADEAQLRAMISALVDIQRPLMGCAGGLVARGLPDWRGPALTAAIADAIERTAAELNADDRAVLDGFLRTLPARLARVAECGLEDTLIHGDFHPGNARGAGTSIVVLDWGDSGVGHPMLEMPPLLQRVRAAEAVQEHWVAEWRRAVPGCDPARAAALLAPVGAARQAAIYRRFLDEIEPSERVYHRGDPADWLRRAAAQMRESAAVA